MSKIVLSAGGKKIVLSAGGTGGHLFPAEALAEELLSRGHQVMIVTDKRGMAFKNLGDRVKVYTVPAATLKAGLIQKIFAIIDMSRGIIAAGRLLKEFKPDLVIGFGGYPSFPAVYAAQLLNIKTMLHEQNAVLGKANAKLAEKAQKIALSLPGTRNIDAKEQAKTIVTGLPLRKSLIDAAAQDYAPATGDFIVLVTGGSLAAHIFADVIPKATALLPADLRGRLYMMHQCREDDVGLASEQYMKAGVRAEIKTFFPDMAARLSSCHLFIGRAGASTVAEAAITGRPAIFVPLMHADGQQKYNAEVLTAKGAGWMMMQADFTPENLAKKLTELMSQPESLILAAKAAKTCAEPHAVKNLADAAEQLAA